MSDEVSETGAVCTVHGDAVGGWIVEVRDALRYEVYWPDAADEDEARSKALEAHAAPSAEQPDPA